MTEQNMTEQNGFHGKTVLVTGASRGIGSALAEQLLGLGANVVISARGEARLAETFERLKAIRPTIAAVPGDVASFDDASRMVQTAIDHFGALDIVVNNAGVSMRGRFADLTPQTCETVLASNLLGSVYVSRAAVEHVAAASGSLVFVSSIAGIFGLPSTSIYCAAKKGLVGLAEALRIELAADRVHVGIAYLGFTEHDPEKRILGADGGPLLPDRPAHHTQPQAAEAMIEMIRKRREAAVLTPIGKVGAGAYRLSPRFVSWAIKRAQTSNLKVFRQFS